jgi:aromatic ring-opening dioxygenase catalytic subunit (LigB family)
VYVHLLLIEKISQMQKLKMIVINGGAIEQRLINIEKSLEKIDVKLDSFDKEVEEKIKEAIEHHVLEMHSEK